MGGVCTFIGDGGNSLAARLVAPPMAYLRPTQSPSPTDAPVAFEAQVLAQLDTLYGVALRLTKNDTSAEDLVQDTIVKAVRARNQFKAGTNLKAWLLRIQTNTFINRHRRGGLEREVLDGPTAAPLVDRWIGASTMRAMRDPEREALAPLIEAEVRTALNALPEHFRLVIVLSDIEGLSYKEIADVVECPVGTVMSRLHRARKLLQVSLRDQAVALGIVSDEAEEDMGVMRRAAAGDRNEPVDLAAYRSRKRGAR